MNYKNFKHVWCVLLCLSAFASSSARFDLRSRMSNACRGWSGRTIGLASAAGVVLARGIHHAVQDRYQEKVYNNVRDAISKDFEGQNKLLRSYFECLKLNGPWDPKGLKGVQKMYKTFKRKPLCESCDDCTYGEVDGEGKHSSKCRSNDDIDEIFIGLLEFIHYRKAVAFQRVSRQSHHKFLQRVRNDREDENGNARRDKTIQSLIKKRQDDYNAVRSFYKGRYGFNYDANFKQWVSTENKYGNEVSRKDYDWYMAGQECIRREDYAKWLAAKRMYQDKMKEDRQLNDRSRKFKHLDQYRQRDEEIDVSKLTKDDYNYDMFGVRRDGGSNDPISESIETIKARLRERIQKGKERDIIDDGGQVMTLEELKAWQKKEKEKAALVVQEEADF